MFIKKNQTFPQHNPREHTFVDGRHVKTLNSVQRFGIFLHDPNLNRHF